MAQTNLIGKNILGYIVSEKLGSGAFGTVYKVIKTNATGQYVRALKHITIPTEKQYNSVLNSMGGDVSKADSYFSQMLNNIVSEIRILNDLSEKDVQHIVRYYENDIVVIDSPRRYDIFILMEYLTPLEDYIQSQEFLVRDVIQIGLDVLYGLQSCHNNGVIHRDIKDDNIFVSERGEYKIGDFGVSKVLKDSCKAESLKGTPNFLAPEVYLGKESYTKSVDLYSLGIVLYRLLNYSRNPFLPCFPEQYFSQDEDVAFEERMRGVVPELPSLGGEAIGRIIVKAISSSSERFQTADEFINALESAIDSTPPEVFNEKISFGAFSFSEHNEEPKAKQYGSTIGETAPQSVHEEHIEDGLNNSLNKHLFESIGEDLSTDVSEIEPVVQTKVNTGQTNFGGNTPPKTIGRVVNVVPTDINEPDEPMALNKKLMNKFVFFIPVIILLVGVVAYFIVIPNIYGKVIWFVDWSFTDLENIINTLCAPNAVLPKVNSIISMRIFWWVWLAGLISSLFFVGKQLQAKPKSNATNAILTKKEPYLMIQDVTDALKQLKTRRSSHQLDSLIYSMKKLEEKLSVESDFGYEKSAVINCENNIARQIQFLLDTVFCVENGDFEENLKAINTTVMNINSLLRRRIELKKK
ncbi:serine/threonine-protein kinase [Thomasclavelia cocleata]|uniref:serine/threonine-protein kinase n=1 Tax=Thomasclavelia cocleata TaxID=69824 RepID=UPI00243256B4|nr:serine/threonine-protein kinase [Thomasclavelia cocleata]